jgi:FKBP-type peptidyl-prolyl cis-trans isomerase 2
MGAALLAGAFLICGDVRAADVIKPGDKVTINFTCRLSNGQIAATTDRTLTEDPNATKSAVLVPRGTADPLAMTAGAEQPELGKQSERGFEGEILTRLAGLVVGMKEGESQSFLLEASPIPAKSKEEAMVMQISRERLRPKDVKMTREEYLQQTGREAEVGQPYRVDRAIAIPCQVVSVSPEEVMVKCRLENGARVETPFGEGVVTESEKGYRITINAKIGHLVRTGGFVGRIAKVDDRMITIDYSHPFGYEALKCEVKTQNKEQRD